MNRVQLCKTLQLYRVLRRDFKCRACRAGFARKVLLSLRSRRKHKAWGASPRIIEQNDFAARETGGSINGSGCRPLSAGSLANLIWTWGLRPRLYAYARYRGLRVRLVRSYVGLLLCATSVSSVPLWLRNC